MKSGLGVARKAAYARAGVDVGLGNQLKGGIQRLVKSTHGAEVLGGIGAFGGMFAPRFNGMREPVLVSSIDSLGTKMKVAMAMGRHDTVGQDIVNHCVNDIAVLGARPLFFLDYIGIEKLTRDVFEELLKGLTKACKAAGCALIGGETAQLPGIYISGEYDLVGCIVGLVDRDSIIDGSKINAGDIVIGLPSSGLHTNGYSLARRVLFEQMKLRPESKMSGLSRTVGDELLRVHRNYQPLISKLPNEWVHGIAHVTGGGLIDNLPRVLPAGVDAVIDTSAWRVPGIFRIIEENGGIARDEMYQVFNMGIGMTLIVPAKRSKEIVRRTRGRAIGRIEHGQGKVRLV
jgi:phosphoribosylformylglycinamidine cyclo-ligase